RRLRYERERQSLFRAQDDRRLRRRSPYGPCAGGHSRARRRVALERVYASDAGAFWFHLLARRSGDAGRDHAAAEMVSLSSRQGFVLEPHRDRAPVGAAGAKAESP